MSPLRRSVAVRLVEALGDDALPAWREMAQARCVGPHARVVLAGWDRGPEPGDADWEWLAVEAAAAALEEKGPDEALSRVWEAWPDAVLDDRLAAMRATGHPDAGPLARAVAEFAASGAPRSIDQVAQLTVSLAGFGPPIWRRVLLPATATLGDLHEVIQVLFGWDGDHLHVFTIGKKRYGDSFGNLEGTGDEEAVRVGGKDRPLHVFTSGKKRYGDSFGNLEGTGDEEAVRVGDAVAAGGRIAYTYDLGACWEHEITLGTTIPREHSQEYPVCVAFRGDSPVEYWNEEEPEEPRPFGLNEVNRRLAALGREPA